MKEYAIVIEQGEKLWSAYVPDLPGCTVSGSTRDDLIANAPETLKLWIDGAKERGVTVREPGTFAVWVSIDGLPS